MFVITVNLCFATSLDSALKGAHNMAQSANTNPGVGQNSKTILDIPMFWERPSAMLPMPLDRWKEMFTIALYAKTNIDVEEVKEFTEKPILILPDPEEETGVETGAQKTAREQ